MSAFVIKIIAYLTMFIDHLGYIIYNGKFSYLNFIGRLSFPIFAFQISEGYIHTKNLKNYFFRLFLFALVSQIPFMLFESILTSYFSLNIIFTLLLGLLSIFIYEKIHNKFLGIIVSVLFGLIAHFSHCDYGFYGVAIVFVFYIFRNNLQYRKYAFFIVTAMRYLIASIRYGYNDAFLLSYISTILSIVFIDAYNGQKGKDTKYILYLFYPFHLLLLYIINLLNIL